MCLTELSAAAISVAAALSSRIGSAPAVLVMAAKPRPRFVTCPGHVLRHRSSLLPSGILRRSFCSRYDVPAGGRGGGLGPGSKGGGSQRGGVPLDSLVPPA